MKYRIIEKTRANGTKLYIPEYKHDRLFARWRPFTGTVLGVPFILECDTHQQAIDIIQGNKEYLGAIELRKAANRVVKQTVIGVD